MDHISGWVVWILDFSFSLIPLSLPVILSMGLIFWWTAPFSSLGSKAIPSSFHHLSSSCLVPWQCHHGPTCLMSFTGFPVSTRHLLLLGFPIVSSTLLMWFTNWVSSKQLCALEKSILASHQVISISYCGAWHRAHTQYVKQMYIYVLGQTLVYLLAC